VLPHFAPRTSNRYLGEFLRRQHSDETDSALVQSPFAFFTPEASDNLSLACIDQRVRMFPPMLCAAFLRRAACMVLPRGPRPRRNGLVAPISDLFSCSVVLGQWPSILLCRCTFSRTFTPYSSISPCAHLPYRVGPASPLSDSCRSPYPLVLPVIRQNPYPLGLDAIELSHNPSTPPV